ncbi:MAG: helix-turn-helix transcriptional regulator [Thermoplasmata archaeon]|nr:helix-turn-helix transcriptional regulator [Thermoplasmata archaeon]
MSLGDIALGFVAGLGTALAVWVAWSLLRGARAARELRPPDSVNDPPRGGGAFPERTAEVDSTQLEQGETAPVPEMEHQVVAFVEGTSMVDSSGRFGAGVPEVTVGTPPDQPSPSGVEGQEISRRVFLHLMKQRPFYDADVAPLALTQEGMATALSVRQGSLAKVLQRLVASGALVVERRHVAHRSTRLKVYRLTQLGMSVARELRPR